MDTNQFLINNSDTQYADNNVNSEDFYQDDYNVGFPETEANSGVPETTYPSDGTVPSPEVPATQTPMPTQQDMTQMLLGEIYALKHQLALLQQGTQNQTQPMTDNNVQIPTIAPPVPPVKPENYSELEAYQDPNSESWKYRKAKEQYQEAMLQYYAQLEEIRMQELAEMQRREEMEKQSYAALNAVAQELQTKYRFTPAEIQDFIQVLSRPETLSLDALVAFYRTIRNGQSQQRSVRNVPASPAVQGNAASTNDINALFVEQLKRKKK